MSVDDRVLEIEPSRSDEDLTPIPLIVVPHRESKLGQRIWPAIAVLALGLAGIVYRASVADWQGLAVVGSRPAPKPRVEAIPTPKPSAEKPTELSLAPKAEVAEPKKVETPPEPEPKVDPWKDIEREAEKKRAEMAELDRIKESEAEKSLHEPLRPVPRQDLRGMMGAMNPQMRRQLEQARRDQIAMHQRFMDQFLRNQAAGPARLQQMMREQQQMMDQMRRMAAAPGWPQRGDDAGFPMFGPDRPGVRTERKRIVTPNGVIIIETQRSGFGIGQ